jgi:hypothetical protein
MKDGRYLHILGYQFEAYNPRRSMQVVGEADEGMI